MNNQDHVGPLRAPEELTIYGAAAFYRALCERFAESGEATIDLSGVAELDTAGVQLLLAGRRAAVARGAELELRGAGESVREVIEFMGVGDLLSAGVANGEDE